MEFGTVLSLTISVIGFITTIATLSRKMVTKEDIKEIQASLKDLSERNTNVEKKLAILEYRLDEIQK